MAHLRFRTTAATAISALPLFTLYLVVALMLKPTSTHSGFYSLQFKFLEALGLAFLGTATRCTSSMQVTGYGISQCNLLNTGKALRCSLKRLINNVAFAFFNFVCVTVCVSVCTASCFNALCPGKSPHVRGFESPPPKKPAFAVKKNVLLDSRFFLLPFIPWLFFSFLFFGAPL